MLGWGEEARLHPSLISLCPFVAVDTDAPPEGPALPRVGAVNALRARCQRLAPVYVRAYVTTAAGSLHRVTSQSCSHLPCTEDELTATFRTGLAELVNHYGAKFS